MKQWLSNCYLEMWPACDPVSECDIFPSSGYFYGKSNTESIELILSNIKISDNKIVLTVTTIDEFESLTTNSDPLTLTCET